MRRFWMDEKGASDAGMALYAFGAAIAVSVVITLRGCIMDFKDARQMRLLSRMEIKQITGIGVQREPGGYTVTYRNL